MEFDEIAEDIATSSASFTDIRRNGYIYVDKTDLIYQLACKRDCCVFTRPRCFGKTLLCSTLVELFKHGVEPYDGHPSYFRGLAIHKLWDDKGKYHVFHISHSFIDDHELEAIKKFLTASSFNRFLQLDALRHDIDTRIATLRDQELQRDTLLKQQSGGNAELIKDYEEAERKLAACKQEAENIQLEIAKLDKQIHKYDIQVQQEPDVKYDTLVKLKGFFEEVADGLLRKKKEKIETEMKEQLNELLISYKGCISKVELSDRMEHFSIKLYHKAGNQISLNQLNAASKQIFIQVLLKVLRNLGDYNPPVMIDTVMGVLDEESRDALMELYFPDLAEQTILLCTTSEIRKDSDYVKLEPFIAKSYTLKRDVEKQCTNVETGYFGIQLDN